VSLGLMSLVLVFPRLSQAPPQELTCAVVGFDPDGVEAGDELDGSGVDGGAEPGAGSAEL
jgi:hypothetical protein